MRTEIIRIGNSQGLRIPKPLLQEVGLSGAVDMSVVNGRLVITPSASPRLGWEAGFKAMVEEGDDKPLLDEDAATEFDRGDWKW